MPTADRNLFLFMLTTRCKGFSPQPLRRNTPNHKGGEKESAKECCDTKRQEYETLNEANKHDREPEHGESNPQVNRENFLPRNRRL